MALHWVPACGKAAEAPGQEVEDWPESAPTEASALAHGTLPDAADEMPRLCGEVHNEDALRRIPCSVLDAVHVQC